MDPSVLLIDTDADALRLTSALMQRNGIVVRGACSFQDVHDAIATAAPAVVVIEPVLQGIDGFELCRAIRSVYEGYRPTVIIASRNVKGDAPRAKADAVGAALFLERPSMDRLLLREVTAALNEPAATPGAAPTEGSVARLSAVSSNAPHHRVLRLALPAASVIVLLAAGYFYFGVRLFATGATKPAARFETDAAMLALATPAASVPLNPFDSAFRESLQTLLVDSGDGEPGLIRTVRFEPAAAAWEMLPVDPDATSFQGGEVRPLDEPLSMVVDQQAISDPEPIAGVALRETLPGNEQNPARETAGAKGEPTEESIAIDAGDPTLPQDNEPSADRHPVEDNDHATAQPPTPVVVRGAESVAQTAPRLIAGSHVDPQYPPAARRMRAGGTVVLRATVRVDGKIGDVEIVQDPAPIYRLGQAAAAAVKRWRYEPGRRGDVAVEMPISIEVEFVTD